MTLHNMTFVCLLTLKVRWRYANVFLSFFRHKEKTYVYVELDYQTQKIFKVKFLFQPRLLMYWPANHVSVLPDVWYTFQAGLDISVIHAFLLNYFHDKIYY